MIICLSPLTGFIMGRQQQKYWQITKREHTRQQAVPLLPLWLCPCTMYRITAMICTKMRMEVASEGGAKGVRGWALRAWSEQVFRLLGLVIVFPSDLSSCRQGFFPPRGSQQHSNWHTDYKPISRDKARNNVDTLYRLHSRPLVTSTMLLCVVKFQVTKELVVTFHSHCFLCTVPGAQNFKRDISFKQ